MKNTMLDRILRNLRMKKVLPIIKEFKDCMVLDVGCGVNYEFLQQVKEYIYGIWGGFKDCR